MTKNKRIKITLDPVQSEVLDTLCLRYHCSKTEIIVKALITLASKRKHNVTILFREPKSDEDNKKPVVEIHEEINDEDLNKLLEEFKGR